MASNDQQLEISESQEHAGTGAAAQARSGDEQPLIEDGWAGRWANLSPKLKKAIVIGLVVGLILLVALVVLTVLLAEFRCSFNPSPPSHMEASAVYTIPGSTNMAKFASYIHVYDLGYLALDIKRMTMRKLGSFITLEDDCVTINIGYTKSDNYSSDATVSMYELKWEFNNGAIDESKRKPYEMCIVDTPTFHHNFKLDHHYSCLERETFSCWKTDPYGKRAVIAELVIKSLELELDGDVNLIQRGKFSKPAWPDSCSTEMAP